MEENEFTFMGGLGGCLVSDLCSCRPTLEGSPLLKKLDEVIALEIQIALMASKKALAELTPKDNIKPLKGV